MAQGDGGPAFPVPMNLLDIAGAAQGMSLRDWFAGQALFGILLKFTPSDSDELKHLAGRVYEMADAMLAERPKAKP